MEFKTGTEVTIHGRKARIFSITENTLQLDFGGYYRDISRRDLESYEQLGMFPNGTQLRGKHGQIIKITSVLPNDQYTIDVAHGEEKYTADVNGISLMLSWVGAEPDTMHRPSTPEIIAAVTDPELQATATRIQELQQRLNDLVAERNKMDADYQRLEASQKRLEERFNTRGETIERLEAEAITLRQQVTDATERAQQAEAALKAAPVASAAPSPTTDEFIIERDAEAIRLSGLKAQGYRFVHLEFVPLNGRLQLCLVAQRSQQVGVIRRQLEAKAGIQPQQPNLVMSPEKVDRIIFSDAGLDPLLTVKSGRSLADIMGDIYNKALATAETPDEIAFANLYHTAFTGNEATS